MEKIVVSGMRPTGAIHLGHYIGVIKNWQKLQEEYKCYFFIADWHALTSNYKSTDIIKIATLDYIRGWLSCGIDPKKVSFYKQSEIAEILYLSQIFLCLTPPGWADRSPSWKDQKLNPKKDLDNLGFYTYPILQAADIAIAKGNLVPVGEDQVSHVEIAREIVRKFNRTYKADLPEPEALLTPTSKLLGLDGGKMSSSVGNVILLNETEKKLQKKINKLKTDDLREGIEKPGNPDNCLAYSYHKIFSGKDLVTEVNQKCRGAKLGCGECKQILGSEMKKELMPISERFNNISDQECIETLKEGTEKVRNDVQDHWKKLANKIY